MERLLITLSFIILLGCGDKSASNFQSLFNGQSFSGWEGDQSFFRIEDQAIVAGSLERKIPKNQFLCTEKSYGDFELKMKVRFNSEANNAGIQFRSGRIPNHHEVIGYQADVGYAGKEIVWGSLYDESRRNKFLARADADQILSLLNKEGWNDYTIRAQGPEIKFWFNGQLILEYTEQDTSVSELGVLCVQIHSGAPAEAWYKDIELKAL